MTGSWRPGLNGRLTRLHAVSLRSLRRIVGATAPGRALRRGAVAGRMFVERRALAATGRRTPPRGRILAYHTIGNPVWGMTNVTARDFERHLQVAVDDGWTFATPAQVLADPGARQLALTFDDGEASVLHCAAPVLRHHGIPATAFVVTGWADGGHYAGYRHVLDWDGVRKLRDAGFALGSHSVTHRDFGRLSADETAQELDRSRRRLQEMAGVEADEFAIPFGQARHWGETAHRLAAEVGYSTVYAHTVNNRYAGTVARTYITRVDRPRQFRAALAGAYDDWDEWF